MMTSDVTWDDVGGLVEAKEALKEHVILPLRFPQRFSGDFKDKGGILLYGAPGTGKTYIVKAVATEANNATFLRISSCDLASKWVAESEKEIRKLFELAREKKPSIIFIDDLEMAFESRSDGDSGSNYRRKTELLAQMEGDNDGIVTLAATSKPWIIDRAIWRRFKTRIYIGLPEDHEARSEIIKSNMRTTSHALTEADFQELGKMTNGFSAADVVSAVRDVIMQPVRDIQTATHFRKISGPSQSEPDVTLNDLLTPCSHDDPGAMEMNWNNVPVDKCFARAIKMSDFKQILNSMKPSITDEELEKLKKSITDEELEKLKKYITDEELEKN